MTVRALSPLSAASGGRRRERPQRQVSNTPLDRDRPGRVMAYAVLDRAAFLRSSREPNEGLSHLRSAH